MIRPFARDGLAKHPRRVDTRRGDVAAQQQKMMAFMMPAVSGYMTWNYASGLALYWTIGNLISIAQQSVMNRR